MADAAFSHPSKRPRQPENSALQNDGTGSGKSTILVTPPEKKQKQTDNATVCQKVPSESPWHGFLTRILQLTVHSTDTLTTQIRSAFDLRRAISGVALPGRAPVGRTVAKFDKHELPSLEDQVCCSLAEYVVRERSLYRLLDPTRSTSSHC